VYLEIIILAELAQRPSHGYELKKRIYRDLAAQVEINSNTLYPALRRFSTDGLVRSVERHDPGRPPRQVYRLTAAGRRRLTTLLTDFEPAEAQRPEEFWTRVAFFDLVDADVRRRVLHARLDALDIMVKKFGELRDRTIGEETNPARWPTQVVDFRVQIAEVERDWIRARLAELH
jgi:DNA-binding PadR family transcriptional regulator